ncbi:MAG TPA: exosortase/archaeosortase family protein [Acidimicrobiales bacterium]|nr:exosortase/archaeosortase family protein [Acidimicrobiales bacterium]
MPTQLDQSDPVGRSSRHYRNRITGELSSRPWFRALLLLAALVVAYRYSLSSLLGSLGSDTPLAYVGLAPFIALGIAVLLSRPAQPAAVVHDRYIDYMVGLPLLGTALLMAVVLPDRMSILFWYYRVDLLSLPLFAAGAIAVLFGAPALWRVRWAVGFLLLAWPVPYNFALDHGMAQFSNLTLVSVRAMLRVLPVATPSGASGGTVFLVHHAGQSFPLSVVSACTGVDSFIGFGLVGMAVLTLVEGGKLAKGLWLSVGMVLVYGLNLVRLMLIFWAGSKFGQTVALDGLHPVLGLLLFGAGVAVMVTGLGRFHLDIRPAPSQARPAPGAAVAPTRWRLHGRLLGAAVVVSVVAAAVGAADGNFGQYGPLAGQMGSPRLVSFAEAPIQLSGWSVQPIDRYGWASQYFGTGAVWTRYAYAPTTGGAATVLADVIDTPDLSSFSTYDVLACYDYHGYGLSGIQRVGLGAGVQATEMTLKIPGLVGRWNALYWVWPVETAQGTNYERIVLLAPVNADYVVTAAYTGASTPTRPMSLGVNLNQSRSFLVHFGQAVIGARSSDPSGGPVQ